MLNYFGTISALVGSLFKSFPILQCIRTMEFNVAFASGKSAVEGRLGERGITSYKNSTTSS